MTTLAPVSTHSYDYSMDTAAGGETAAFQAAKGAGKPRPVAARAHPAGPAPRMSITARDAIRSIVGTNAVLQRQTDLSPANEVINQTLGEFVTKMTAHCDPEQIRAVLADAGVQAARSPLLAKLSQAEGEMEMFWAASLQMEAKVTVEVMKKFLYFDNYEQLTQLELDHFGSNGDMPTTDSRVAFVGSGALPLSAIMLHLKTGAHVTCVDCDPAAVRLSRGLIRKAGLDSKITVMEAKGEEADFSGHSHVIVAALVPDQAAVMRRALLQAPLARLGVRSADGLRAMLYPPTDIGAIENLGTVATGQSKTNRTVINTMQTYRIAPRIMAPLDAGDEHGTAGEDSVHDSTKAAA